MILKIQVDATTQSGVFVASNVFESQYEADAWMEYQKESPDTPNDLSFVQTDVTQMYLDHDMIEKGVEAQSIGRRCVALAYAINAQKRISPQKLNAMFADPTLAMAERLLKNGALLTGKLLLQSISRDFFTEDEIKRVTNLIDKSGLI